MSTTSTVYYVTAHPDDWQLFRGYNAWHDMQQPAHYGVFITVTAGDGGKDEDYWRARERGETASVLACLPADTTVEPDKAEVNGHRIQRQTFTDSAGDKRAVLYSLRLPDGDHDGQGYSTHHHESLPKLRAGVIASIEAVDSSATYNSWEDLWTTLQAIMTSERQEADPATNNPWVNANRYWRDENASEADHLDHLTVGGALNEFLGIDYSIYWWESYESQSQPANLTGTDLAHKKAVYDAYAEVMIDADYTPRPSEWEDWGDKMYGMPMVWEVADQMQAEASAVPTAATAQPVA